MKSITREEWIAALRSGDYPQTTGFLKSDGSPAFTTTSIEGSSAPAGYCCLGVACAIAGVNLTEYDPDTLRTTDFVDVEADFLYEALNLTDDDCEQLGMWNDAGETFSQIADRIESGKIFED